MGQIRRGPPHGRGHGRGLGLEVTLEAGLGSDQDGEQGVEVLDARGLVHADADRAGVDLAQVEARCAGRRVDLVGALCAQVDREGVEHLVTAAVQATGGKGGPQAQGQAAHAARDALEPVRAVPHRVHAGHDRQQDLRRADVAGGLVAADVLLARLERHAQGATALGVLRDADDSPGDQALELLARGEERRVGAAVAHGDAEALRGAHGHIRARVPGRLEHGEGKQVGGHHQQRARVVDALGEGREGLDLAAGPGVLLQHAAGTGEVRGARVPHLDRDADGLSAGAQDGEGLRVAARAHEEAVALLPRAAPAEAHGLGRCRRLVQERAVREGETAEVRHHGLVDEQSLEAALTDLCLIRRVLRVPRRILEHVAQHHRRRDRAVVSLPDERTQRRVLASEGVETREGLGLARGGLELQLAPHANGAGNRLGHELLGGGAADGREHRDLIVGTGAQVARGEGVGREEVARSGHEGS